MAVKNNTLITTNTDVAAREIDFVSRFTIDMAGLLDLMGIARPIKKTPGTNLVYKIATVNLQSGDVAEGDEIPYSEVTITERPAAELKIKKYAKGVSLEMIDKYGYDLAVAKTDNALLNKLHGVATSEFYSALAGGTLTDAKTTFQQAVANAKGLVSNEFKKLNLDASAVIGFVNVLDFYDYAGDAPITVQNAHGLDYIENFMGYKTIFLLSENEVARGEVFATPVENVNLYYIDAGDSDFARAGLSYTTDGETNLVGFHTEGKYSHAVSESYAIMGATLFAEYLNGIAQVTFTGE